MMRVAATALALVGLFALSVPTSAEDLRLLAAERAALPKGSYQQSCQCEFSGGLTLMCLCQNPEGRYFQTTMDVRKCPLPKDIKNCKGNLTCVDPKSDC
jgi:hypothetical protein